MSPLVWYHFYIVRKIQCLESLGLYITITLYCAKASNVSKIYITITFVLFKHASNIRKVYIAITFVLCKDIWRKFTFKYHFCTVRYARRHPISVKFTLYGITFILCENIQLSGKSIIVITLYCAKAFNVRKVYIAVTFVLCIDIQCQ